MKQLVILSGKGGTGKTSISAAFAHLAGVTPGLTVVLVDADVDASNLDLVLEPKVKQANDFYGAQVAVIDPLRCSGCAECMAVCRFDAISQLAPASISVIDKIACEGCAACQYACPSQAITMQPELTGQWCFSESAFGPLFHASLRPAQENSGKLVSLIKRQAVDYARQIEAALILVDGPPGIACPAISAISGADMILLVTEPTAAGVHDLERISQTIRHFNVPMLVCLNKADIYPAGAAAINAFCQANHIPLVGAIPFDTVVTQAMVQGVPVTAFSQSDVATQINNLWHKVFAALNERASLSIPLLSV